MKMQCRIHDIVYDEHASPNTNTATTCPICMEESYHRLRKQCERAEAHRDLLLEVIEIKVTQTPV